MFSTEQKVADGHNLITSVTVGTSDLELLLRERSFTRAEAKRFTEIIRSRFPEPLVESENNNGAKELRVVNGHNSITSMKVGFSDLEELLRLRIFTRFEAKQLMEIIDSRSIEPHKSESESNRHAKGSFIQGDTTSPYDEWCRAKTLDLSIAKKSAMSLSTAPMVPGVTNIAARPWVRAARPWGRAAIPWGRAANYRMNYSPDFNIDPLIKEKRGSKYTWNAGGRPSSSQCASKCNLNSYEKQGSSFQDDKTSPYCGSYRAKNLHLPIPTKSVTSLSAVPVIPGVTKIAARPGGRSAIYRMARSPYFNIDPLAKEKMGREYTRNVGGWNSSSQLLSSRNLKSYEKQWRDVSFVNDGNGLLDHISSTNTTISTLHSQRKPYFHISAPEVPSDIDEEDDETDIFVHSSLGSSKPKGNVVSSTDTNTINSSHATIPSQGKSYFHMSMPEVLFDSDEDCDSMDASFESSSDLDCVSMDASF